MSDVFVVRDGNWFRDVLLCCGAYGVSLVAGLAVGKRCPGEHPLEVALAGDVAATGSIFAFSFAFDNSSFYDAYWSVVPPVIAAYWMNSYKSVGDSKRQGLVMTVMTAWSLRLTFNWLRGWAGLGHEDWRYGKIKGSFPDNAIGKGGYWLLGSFGGIHLFPTAMVYSALLPAWGAMRGSKPLGLLDWTGAAVGLGSVTLQAVADEQLRNYRIEKPTTGRYGPGVIDVGVWRWCRHPNYTGEMGHWLAYVLMALGADRDANWWAFLPWLPMVALFSGASVPLMETRMLAKKPRFADYVREVPCFIPLPPKSK